MSFITLDFAPLALIQALTQNPLNWALLAVVIYLLLGLSTSSQPSLPPSRHPDVVLLKNFTPAELSQFDGLKTNKIYMGVNGRVYDVTRGASFYGPGGMYGNFAGRDASRGLAKNSFEESMLTPLDQPIDKLDDLEEEEWQSLREWAAFFEGKYDHIGFLVEPSGEK
ncbi:hypothetical protein HK102_004524 [Quaeritorhiza haematococci]|nr:hypothetical protein HK102_004524 [Quaeritorhiza haematococci]